MNINDIIATLNRYGITNKLEISHFLAQTFYESAGYTKTSESLNYSPEGLCLTFGNRITKDEATKYGRTNEHPANQQQIANIVYAGRFGNGDVISGDGWKFRGAGYIQTTFKANHLSCLNWLNNHHGYKLIIDNIGDFLRGDGALISAIFFWTQKVCKIPAQKDDCKEVTLRIHGGIGDSYAERKKLTDKFKRELGV